MNCSNNQKLCRIPSFCYSSRLLELKSHQRECDEGKDTTHKDTRLSGILKTIPFSCGNITIAWAPLVHLNDIIPDGLSIFSRGAVNLPNKGRWLMRVGACGDFIRQEHSNGAHPPFCHYRGGEAGQRPPGWKNYVIHFSVKPLCLLS